MIERDLKFLIAVLNWAAKSRDEQGRLLLDSNPLQGLKTPKEKNPTRVVLVPRRNTRRFSEVSRQVDWRFRVALVLTHETGHRIGAIRKLRWSDIDMEERVVRWRAEHEKSGYEHRTPVTIEAIVVLEEARKRNPGIGDTPLLPAARNPSACVGSALARVWWKNAQNPRGTRPEARQRLALPEAEVRFGSHGPAGSRCSANSAAGRRPKPCSSATSGRTRDSSGRRSRDAGEFAADPIGGNQVAGIQPVNLVTGIFATGYGYTSIRLAGADLHPHVASSAPHVPLPLGGSEGAQPPASPCPGTREAWPQRVGWLSRRSGGRQARPPQPRTLRLNAPHRPLQRAHAPWGSRLGPSLASRPRREAKAGRVLHQVVERKQAAHGHGGRGVAAVADALGECPARGSGHGCGKLVRSPECRARLLGDQASRDQRARRAATVRGARP